jgi:hypothetical protein
MREAIHRTLFRGIWPSVIGASLLLGSAGCGLDKQKVPDLTGPADVGVSTELVAAPDVLNADGVSQSVVRLVLRDQDGKPISGRAVLFEHDGDGYMAPSTASTYVGPVQTGIVMATDKDGVAYVVYVAGTQPGRKIRVTVRPYGIDTSYTPTWRSVEITQK